MTPQGPESTDVESPGRQRGEALSSVTNAVRLLKQFSGTGGELGVTELSKGLGVSKSTAHRLLATLVQEGLLERDEATGRYRLGVVVYELGLAVPLHRQLHLAATPIMESIRTRTGQGVYIGVLRGRQTYLVVRSESRQHRGLASRVKASYPAHAQAAGKVLLANLPDAELRQVLDGWRLPRLTPATVTSIQQLQEQLVGIRRAGYATCGGEAEPSMLSAAAPIQSPSGRTLASIVVVAEGAETSTATLTGYARVAVDGAAAISRRLARIGSAS